MADRIVQTQFEAIDTTTEVVDRINKAYGEMSQRLNMARQHMETINKTFHMTDQEMTNTMNSVRNLGTEFYNSIGKMMKTQQQFSQSMSMLNKQMQRMSATEVGKVYTAIKSGGDAAAKAHQMLTESINNTNRARQAEISRIKEWQRNMAMDNKMAEANARARQRQADTMRQDLRLRAQQIAARAREMQRVRQMQETHDDLNKTLNNQASLFKRINSHLFRYRMMTISVMVAVYLLKRALEAAWDFTYEGAQINEQMAAMDRLAARYGTTSESMVSSLRKISKETISNADIMQSAGKAMVMGISPDTLNTLMKVSTEAAKVMGKTAKEMFADITLGTARMSKKILDNIGIIVDWNAAYSKHASMIGKTVKSLTEEEKVRARLNAIAEAGSKIVDTLNSKYDTQREKLDRLTASWHNYVNELKQSVVNAIIPLEGLESIMERIGDTQDKLKPIGELGFKEWFEQSIGGMNEYRNRLAEQLDLDVKIKSAYESQLKLRLDINDTMSKTQTILDANKKLLDDVTDKTKTEKLTDAYKKNKDAISDIQKELVSLTDTVDKARKKVDEYNKKLKTADKDQKKALLELKDYQESTIELYVKQSEEAINSIKTMESNMDEINKAITEKEKEEIDKRIANTIKLYEKYDKVIRKSEADISKIMENEDISRLKTIQLYLDKELVSISEARKKALDGIKANTDAEVKIIDEAEKAKQALLDATANKATLVAIDVMAKLETTVEKAKGILRKFKEDAEKNKKHIQQEISELTGTSKSKMEKYYEIIEALDKAYTDALAQSGTKKMDALIDYIDLAKKTAESEESLYSGLPPGGTGEVTLSLLERINRAKVEWEATRVELEASAQSQIATMEDNKTQLNQLFGEITVAAKDSVGIFSKEIGLAIQDIDYFTDVVTQTKDYVDLIEANIDIEAIDNASSTIQDIRDQIDALPATKTITVTIKKETVYVGSTGIEDETSMGNFHSGGIVPKTGNYLLQKGESVIPNSVTNNKYSYDNRRYSISMGSEGNNNVENRHELMKFLKRASRYQY